VSAKSSYSGADNLVYKQHRTANNRPYISITKHQRPSFKTYMHFDILIQVLRMIPWLHFFLILLDHAVFQDSTGNSTKKK